MSGLASPGADGPQLELEGGLAGEKAGPASSLHPRPGLALQLGVVESARARPGLTVLPAGEHRQVGHDRLRGPQGCRDLPPPSPTAGPGGY